jgi:hypothetical protein
MLVHEASGLPKRGSLHQMGRSSFRSTLHREISGLENQWDLRNYLASLVPVRDLS